MPGLQAARPRLRPFPLLCLKPVARGLEPACPERAEGPSPEQVEGPRPARPGVLARRETSKPEGGIYPVAARVVLLHVLKRRQVPTQERPHPLRTHAGSPLSNGLQSRGAGEQ